jgi:hypothetical protein
MTTKEETPMPVDVMRPATVYRLWDSADRDALFSAHAEVGWVCQLTTQFTNGVLGSTVLLQHNATQQTKHDAIDKVVVSDLTNVEILTVDAYNQLYPQNPIEAP